MSDGRVVWITGCASGVGLHLADAFYRRDYRVVATDINEAGLAAAAVIVLGHEAFYPRFGFSAELARRLDAPFRSDAFMALELQPGALAGVRGAVRYPAAFGLDG